MNNGMMFLALVGAVVWWVIDLAFNTKQKRFDTKPTVIEYVPAYELEPERKCQVDILSYCRVRKIPSNLKKKFERGTTEDFLDWIKENMPYDYTENFWIKTIRRDWYAIVPDTKHRPDDKRLA